MLAAHAAHGDAPDLLGLLPLALVAAVGLGYLVLALRAHRRQGWSAGRTVAFVFGLALIGWALAPPFDALAERDFGGHAAQHLVLAMIAPLLLVLGTPVTLLLRALPHRVGRRLGSALASRPAGLLVHPAVALALSSGGLVALYATPLYRWSTESTIVHLLVHAHLVLSGFLFAWVIAGLDPSPHRAGVRARLATLGAAIVVHAAVSQLLYAGVWLQVDEPARQLQAAGSLMYFGGDIAELVLALVMLLAARPGHAQPKAAWRVDTLRAETR